MIRFEWLWALALLPLPLLVRYLLPAAASVQQAALRVPFMQDFGVVQSNVSHSTSRSWSWWLALLAWVLFILAVARPQWLGDPIELPVSGRDLMLAVDLSGSMATRDFEIKDEVMDRLTATKVVAGRFIDGRVGDRLGLILFGRQAYLQTPLTFDRETVKTLLQESVIGLAGKETAIGDAIGLAVKRFKQSKDAAQGKPVSKQILILLTDGANTAGEVDPVQAADMAAAEGMTIYTIGVGADEMLVRSLFGVRRFNPSADLDETALKAIADKTGGKYFRARDTVELQKIYHMLDELEPVVKDAKSFRPRSALYPWPLGLALAIASVLLLQSCVRVRA
jgi:Ca-activated chloride channel family protein